MKMNKKLFKGNFDETVSIAGSCLQEGEQTRDLLCPNCSGGLGKEKSFSIRKEKGDIKFRCWRASCGIRGFLPFNGSIFQDSRSIPELESKDHVYARHFQGSLTRLNEEGYAFFKEKFDLEEADLAQGEVRYVPDSNRYSFPVYGPEYMMRGTSLRTFEDNTNFPKWDHYPVRRDINWIGWHIRPCNTHNQQRLAVVEDPISSLKVSRHFMCTYLNGTSMNMDKMLEIMRVGRQRGVTIALDKDATAKAIDILREWRFFLGAQAICVPIDKDLKYASDKEIKEIFTTRT